MSLYDKLYAALGYEDNPGLGAATTASGSALLGSLLFKLMDKDPLKGAATGGLLGTAASAPLLAKSMIDHAPDGNPMSIYPLAPAFNKRAERDESGWGAPSGSFLSSPIRLGGMQSLLASKDTLDSKFRQMTSDTLIDAGQNAKGHLTIGDIASAGIRAGLGGVGGFALGAMLGSRNPKNWAGVGAAITGGLSLGKSTGIIR